MLMKIIKSFGVLAGARSDMATQETNSLFEAVHLAMHIASAKAIRRAIETKTQIVVDRNGKSVTIPYDQILSYPEYRDLLAEDDARRAAQSP
jgi:hypothetical protein